MNKVDLTIRQLYSPISHRQTYSCPVSTSQSDSCTHQYRTDRHTLVPCLPHTQTAVLTNIAQTDILLSRIYLTYRQL